MKVNPTGHSSSPYKTIGGYYLPEITSVYILVLYDVTPVSQRKTQYFNP